MSYTRNDSLDLCGLPHPAVALHEGDLRTALQAFAALEMFDYQRHGRFHSDVWVCGFGTCMWLLGENQRAIDTWTVACEEALKGKFHYSNSGLYGPGLLLWFASAWLHDEGLREYANSLFEKLLKKRRPAMGSNDTSMFARLLRRETNLEEILEQYRNAHPYDVKFRSPVYVGFEREACFYAGVTAYEENKREITLELWGKAAPLGEPSLDLSYYIMEHEKSRLEDTHS